MRLRSPAFALLFALTSLAVTGGGAQEHKKLAIAAIDRAAWPKLLADPWQNHLEIEEYALKSPETSFDDLKAMWKAYGNPDGKKYLLHLYANPANPRVFDILDLGMTDSSGWVQDEANDLLADYSFHNYRYNLQGYADWRKQSAGKTLEAVIVENERAALTEIAQAKSGQITDSLQPLEHVHYDGKTPCGTLRRQAALAGGLEDSLTRWLAPDAWKNAGKNAGPNQPHTAAVHALSVWRNLAPDEEATRRVVFPLLAKTNPVDIRDGAFQAIAAQRSPWSVETLLQALPGEYPEGLWKTIVLGLGRQDDPRLIPTLIAIMDADDSADVAETVSEALRIVTKTDQREDNVGWRRWWAQHKADYPAAVAAMPFPKLTLARTDGLFLRRKMEWRQINGDPQQTYLLISPGLALPSKMAPKTAALTVPKAAGEMGTGLLVVLADPDSGIANANDFWMEAAQKALKGNYLVALPVPPKWGVEQNPLWVTEKDRASVKNVRFTTEQFLATIAADVCARYPARRDHIFLAGVAGSGLSVYAVSLAPVTPFRGFYLLDSPFSSAQLPPLTGAKGRKYFLQQDPASKANPFWKAQAARQMLVRQGASVTLSNFGKDRTQMSPSNQEQIGQAIHWLETGK